MASRKIITRRVAILGGFAGAGWLIANTDKLTLNSDFGRVFRAVEDWTKTAQRGLLFPERLAREYSPSDISPFFKPNGTYNPGTPEYNTHAVRNFADWRLKIDGAVESPCRCRWPS